MQIRSTLIFLVLLCSLIHVEAQHKLKVEGNGLFQTPASTNVDIHNTDDNTNTLVRFGDNSLSKVSLGFNGNEDVFKISTASTLGVEDFTMSLTGDIGINSLPGNHRMLINHNSTSGLDGSAHLVLQENNTVDFSRLRFSNLGSDALWTIATRATDGSSLMNFFYNDGSDFANILSLDGDLFRVGIHETAPEAYLHIKQDEPGINALVLENDDQTGSEKWGMQIGNSNLDFLFEGVIRGSFSSATGAYTAFPPPAAFTEDPEEDQVEILSMVLRLNPVNIPLEKSKRKTISLNPEDVERVNPDWVVRSEDGRHLGINYQQFVALAVKSVQEQQKIIQQQQREIAAMEAEEAALEERLARIEAQVAALAKGKGNSSELPVISAQETSEPDRIQLKQNVPNPFREETLIDFEMPATATNAEIHLVDIKGNIRRKFRLSNGQSQLRIKANALPAGVYFYSLFVDGELIETRQMLLQK